ncbi:MAG: hypothetical protein MI924_34700 [Chloroflexales bacterium]|nr:hypothetical protein [Chloroflexales bacterium]
MIAPINATILAQVLAAGEITWWELAVSTVIVATMLLSLLPTLFRRGKIVMR